MSQTPTPFNTPSNENKQLNLESHSASSPFPFRAPEHYLRQIDPNDPNDPLLKQIAISQQEAITTLGYSQDPVGDLKKNPTPGFIHKYQGRALLIASPKCNIHCRYCFRRHFPYKEQSNRKHWVSALEKIAADDSLHEIILSGGDPMSLKETVALELIHKIEIIPHITTLRIHSRVPVTAPNNAWQQNFLKWASKTHLNIVIVLHCNHPNELSSETHDLFARYRQHGIHLLNQSVLLKDVNNDHIVLEALSHKLFSQGVMPYYLHLLDKVQGAAHFEVDDSDALELIDQIRRTLPGYLVPKLVREMAGKPYKSPM